MNIENEYKEFNDYWNETIKGNSWTTLERQACFMGWIEAKKRVLNSHNVAGQSEQLVCDLCNGTKYYHNGSWSEDCPKCTSDKAN